MTKKTKPPASVLVRAKIPATTYYTLERLAKDDNVTVPTFLRSIVEAYLRDPDKLQHRPALVGLAAASAETRAKVARSGGKAKAKGAKK